MSKRLLAKLQLPSVLTGFAFFLLICAVDFRAEAQATITIAGAPKNNIPAMDISIKSIGIASTPAGDIIYTDYPSRTLRRIDHATGIVTTIAGTGEFRLPAGYNGTSGPALLQSIDPQHVAVSPSGDIYFSETDLNRIRKLNINTGKLTTVIGRGDGITGFSGDGVLPPVVVSVGGPQSLVFAPGGDMYFADTNNSRIRKFDHSNGIVTTIAGNGIIGNTGNNGPATSAALSSPVYIAVDGNENVYVSDSDWHVIRKIDAVTGIISVFAGTGVQGSSGDGGLAINAELDTPCDLMFHNGFLYISSQGGITIRRIDLSDGTISAFAGASVNVDLSDGIAATNAALVSASSMASDASGNIYLLNRFNIRKISPGGIITTIAGTRGLTEENILARNAIIRSPNGIVADSHGNVYFTEEENHRIRKIEKATSMITTVKGEGDGLFDILALGIDKDDNLYVADKHGRQIRKILATDGTMSIIAGVLDPPGYDGDGGLALDARLSAEDIVFEEDGSMLIASKVHHVVRRIDAATGIITTIAGTGVGGFNGNDIAATSAQFYSPSGVCVDSDGNIYIADRDNRQIRKISKTSGVVTVVVEETDPFTTADGMFFGNGVEFPQDLFISGSKLYIAAQLGIYAKDLSTGDLQLITGISRGFAGENQNRSLSVFGLILAINMDGDGNLLVADNLNNRIRKSGRAQQTITFPAIAFTGPEIQLTASSDSNLPVSFTSSDTDVAIVAGNKLHVIGPGTTTITALQDGNVDFYPATSVAHDLTVPVRQSQTITFPPLPEMTLGDLPFPLSATSSSGLAVIYESKDENVAQVENNKIVLRNLGIVTIIARQPGDVQYEAAIPLEHSFEIVSATSGLGLAVLIADINKAAAPVSTTGAVAGINGKILLALNGPTGEELYSTLDVNTTPELLVDLVPGVASGAPKMFTRSGTGNLLYFVANTSMSGHDLWYTDGTIANTKKFKLPINGVIRTIGKFNDGVLFKIHTDREYLLYADATLDEAEVLFEFEPGNGGLTPDPILELNGKAILTGHKNGGRMPFVTDGTTVGTIQIKYNENVLEVNRIDAVYNGKAYFVEGAGLYVTDGTSAGTAPIHPQLSFVSQESFHIFNNDLYFTNTTGITSSLWKLDENEVLTLIKTGVSFTMLADLPNAFLFSTFPLGYGPRELWSTDGTIAGTTQVTLLEHNGQPFVPSSGLTAGNKAIIIGHDITATDYQVWFSDGTAEGTQIASVLPEHSKVSSSSVVGTTAFVQTQGYPINELHFFDAATSAHNTIHTPQASGGASPSGFVTAGDKVIFNAINGAFDGEVWTTAGDETSTEALVVSQTSKSAIEGAVSTPNGAYLSLDNGLSGFEPWKSDGTKTGTTNIVDLSVQVAGSKPNSFTYMGNQVFFRALAEPTYGIFKTDGTAGGTSAISDRGVYNDVVHVANGHMYFVDSQLGGLYKSDGTATGTLAIDANLFGFQFYNAGKTMRFGEAIGNYLYLFAHSPTSGSELRKVDLTTDAITIVKDITPGYIGTELMWMHVFAGNLYLMTTDADGSYLWMSDGSGAGTVLVKSFDGIQYESEVITFGSRFYFSARTNSGGVELWTSGGTEPTTTQVTDFVTGLGSSDPTNFFVTHDRLLFSIHDNTLWQITVDNSNPHRVELGSGLDYHNSTWNFHEYGDLALFSGYNPDTGTELWALDFRSENLPLEFLVGNKTYDDPDFTLSAFFSSGTDIVYSSSNPDVVAITGNTARIMGTGSVALSASVAGTSSVKSSKLETIVTVARAQQSIAFNSIEPKTFGAQTFQLVATSSSSLPVTFTSLNTDRLTISDNTATIVGAGSVDIAAIQAGDNNYHPAEKIQTLIINKANQTITFPLISSKTIGDPAFSLNATSTSQLPISYMPTGDKIIVTENNLAMVRAGRAVVTATQPGNDNYNVASAIQQTFCINPVKALLAANGVTTPTPVLTSSSDTDNQWYKNGSIIAGATSKTYTVTADGVYTVVVRVDDCTSEPSLPVNITIVGDIDEGDLTFELYPNPASSEIVIRINGGSVSRTNVQVMDIYGRVLDSRQISADVETRVDVRGLQDGMYLVKVGADIRKVQILR
jgi:ELWxxDGT repeat protein